jgi:hypothetical protein
MTVHIPLVSGPKSSGPCGRRSGASSVVRTLEGRRARLAQLGCTLDVIDSTAFNRVGNGSNGESLANSGAASGNYPLARKGVPCGRQSSVRRFYERFKGAPSFIDDGYDVGVLAAGVHSQPKKSSAFASDRNADSQREQHEIQEAV